jgi:hypothetical protein
MTAGQPRPRLRRAVAQPRSGAWPTDAS